MQTTTATTTQTSDDRLLLPVQGRFYLRPIGQCCYGDEAGRGKFELVELDAQGRPYPCGRSIAKNRLGLLVVEASNGRICCEESDGYLNDVADAARRKLMEQGW